MSCNLPLLHRSHRSRVQGGRQLEVNIPQQQIHAKSNQGGLINEGGIMLSEYSWYCCGFIQTELHYYGHTHHSEQHNITVHVSNLHACHILLIVKN